jgi:outer membrane protein
MNVKCVLRFATIAVCLAAALPARAFDPLFAERTIPANASGNFMPGTDPCDFGPIGMPLGLREAVERALCHNPKTRESWAGVEAQAAAVGVARAAYLPTISGNGQAVRDNSVVSIANHPALSSNTASTVRSESVSLNWVLFDFGGRSAALQNANALLAAAKATQDATLQTTFATVAKDYYAAQAAQGSLDVARDVERMTHESMIAAQARVDRGIAPVTDGLQAQTQHEQAVFQLVKARGDAKTALGALAADMDSDPSEPLDVPPVTDVEQPGKDFDEAVGQLIDEVKRTHPGVLAAQAQYDAAVAKVAQTRAEGLPSLSLVAKYSRNSQPQSLGLGMPSYPSTGRDAYIGVQLTIPFFEGFGRHYQADQARAEAERQADVVDETKQQVALDVWKSYYALATATQNVTNSTNLLTISQQAFAAAQHRYEHGVGNILELLNTQAALANALGRRIQALTDWGNARIDLGAKVGRLQIEDAGRH